MIFSKMVAIIVAMVFVAGCAVGKRVNIDPSNPVYKPKSEFEVNYGLFITPNEEKNGYAAGFCPGLAELETVKPFNEIDTLAEFLKFEKCFWEIRDTDPNTPENEFKELIDGRIQDIKNEIFATDLDIPGTRFEINGGLKGDLAHVYLLWGVPHFKEKLPVNRNVFRFELMAWYYFYDGRVLASFLFYENYGRVRLFKEHAPLFGFETLF